MKKNNNRYKKVYPIGIFIFLVGITVSFLSIILSHNIFNIQTINIEGNKEISKSEIIKRSDALGENIFLLRKNKIKNRILNDEVIKVELSKELPNILNIKIKENLPIAFIGTKDNNYVIIDTLGKIKGAEQEQRPDLPEISGVSVSEIRNGKSIFDDNNINIIFNLFNEKNVEIIKYDFSDENNIELNTSDFVILLGDIKHLEEKINFIDNLIHDISINNTSVSKIDLRNIEIPIIIKE